MASDQKTYRRKPKEKISKNDKYSKRDFNASITAEQAMTEDIKAALSAIYERTGYQPGENIYKGEMLVLTHRGSHGLEKKIYIKDTFIKENNIHLDADSKDLALKYDVELLKELVKNNVLKKDDVESVINQMEKEEKQMRAFGEWLKENTQATEKERHRYFETLTMQTLEERQGVSFSIRKLLSLREVILGFQNNNITSPLFKNYIDHKTDFAMTKPVADKLAHLPSLLCTSSFEPLYENMWKLSAKITGKNSEEPVVELEYTFLATSQGEAEQLAEHYKEALKRGGLKVLLAYWKMACNQGKFVYSAHLHEIMELTSSNKRTSYYNMEERKRFWALTRLLEGTKLSIPFIQRNGSKRGKKIKAEHRLLEILNRSVEEENGCPIEVKIRVIDQNIFENKSQLATAVANNILALDENDVMLGFSLEVRASQRRNHKGSTIDSNFIVDKGNLAATAKSNPRVAKKRGKEKLDRLKKAQVGIIEWQDTPNGEYNVEYKKRPTTKKND